MLRHDAPTPPRPPADAAAPERVALRVGGATVLGVRRRGVSHFAAIPYALPPLGERRFAPPVPAPWRGELDATRPGPIPPQGPSSLARVLGSCEAPASEDCLHLSVWTPAADGQRRPVLVWCHGGAWQNGGVLGWYSGEALARRGDVVVVGVSARLGALGWLLADGGVGNLGLLDLELAFQWVHERIAAFGGDPARITAMGQSAGGANLAALLARGAPPFQRVILQSAPLGRAWRSAGAARAIGQALLQAAGAATLDEARRLPLGALLRAQQDPSVLAVARAQADGHGLFAPVLDGATLSAGPSALDAPATAQVDALVGWNREETRAFSPPGAPWDAEATERSYAAPARQWTAQTTQAGRRAWLYRFDGAPGMPFGACHCAELPFVFGTREAFASAPMLGSLDAAEGDRLTEAMQGAWLDFVHGRDLPWAPAPRVHRFA